MNARALINAGEDVGPGQGDHAIAEAGVEPVAHFRNVQCQLAIIRTGHGRQLKVFRVIILRAQDANEELGLDEFLPGRRERSLGLRRQRELAPFHQCVSRNMIGLPARSIIVLAAVPIE